MTRSPFGRGLPLRPAPSVKKGRRPVVKVLLRRRQAAANINGVMPSAVCLLRHHASAIDQLIPSSHSMIIVALDARLEHNSLVRASTRRHRPRPLRLLHGTVIESSRQARRSAACAVNGSRIGVAAVINPLLSTGRAGAVTVKMCLGSPTFGAAAMASNLSVNGCDGVSRCFVRRSGVRCKPTRAVRGCGCLVVLWSVGARPRSGGSGRGGSAVAGDAKSLAAHQRRRRSLSSTQNRDSGRKH